MIFSFLCSFKKGRLFLVSGAIAPNAPPQLREKISESTILLSILPNNMPIIRTNATTSLFSFKYFLAIDCLILTIAILLRKNIKRRCHLGLNFASFSR